jgi:hypothetical protein
MPPGSRAGKRTYSQSFPEQAPSISRSQPTRSSTSTRKQSRLAFSQSTSQEVLWARSPPPQERPRSRSPSASQESSIVPSESASNASRPLSGKIPAARRIYFEVDLSKLELEGVFRTRARNIRGINKGRISWIYLYGLELEKIDKEGHSSKYWLCKPCFDDANTKVMSAASTFSCSEHLRRHHKILPPGSSATPTTTSSIDPYLGHRHPLAEERWQTAFINWIANNDITFEAATDPTLHTVILQGGPHIRHLLPSRPTIRQWLLDTYHERLLEVKESLTTARSRVTISLDGWSAGNHLALLGVVGHWLNKDGNLITALLGIRPITGHDGESIAHTLAATLKTFDITDSQISAFQMDNASNNDTTLQALATEPSLEGIDPKSYRLRCLGHIINLVVKALLFGNRSPSLQKALEDSSDADHFKIWRAQGAIGRLHNLVTYIARSESRLRAFEAAQKVDASDLILHLKRDFGVKWNSTYAMIERALQLKPALQRYCREWQPAKHDSYNPRDDFLDAADWEELYHFEELLQPFLKATKRVEGNAYTGTHGALWEVIPTLDYLFIKLRRRSNEVLAHPELFTDYYTHCLNHGFDKLSEYYTKIDESPYYAAAIALHPCKKFDYFEKTWGPNKGGTKAIATAKRAVRALFTDYIQKERAAEPATPSPPPQSVADANANNEKSEDEDWDTAFGDHTERRVNELARVRRKQQEGELDRFMNDSLDICFKHRVGGEVVSGNYLQEPLRWWRERGEALYPTLATMAYDLFAMPGMSSECERVFSAAKRVITDDRYSLKPDIIEADLCLKNWFKHGLADGQAAFINIAGNALAD